MYNNRWLRAVQVACLVSSASCIASKQYTLKLDPSAPQNNTICERGSDEPVDKPATCRPVTSATLDGTSTLTVELDNAEPARTYVAHIEQTTQSAAGATPQAVIAEVLDRFASVLKTVSGKAMSPGALLESDATVKLEQGLRTIGRNDVAGTLVTLRDTMKPAVATSLAIDGTWMVSAVPAAGATPAGTAHFRANKDVIAKDPNPDRPLFGTAFSLPPGRDRPLTPDVFEQLVAKGFDKATVDEELVRHVIDVCSDFGTEPYDGNATAWAPFLEGMKLDSLRGPDVLHDIGIDAAKLYQLMRGKDTSVLTLLRDARNAAKKAFEAGARPTPAQVVIHLLYATSALYDDATVCTQNIDFVTALTKDPALKKKLATARASAARIVVSATVGRDLFRAFIEPMVTRAVVDALTAGGTTHVTFGAISLHPGKINVNVSDGATPAKQVANYELRVASAGAISIAFGPMIGVCTSCFETVAEEVRPGDGAMIPEARILRRDRRGFGVAVATLVQFPLVARSWFEFGPCIGYPISDIGGTNKAILAGISLGHRAGVSLALGVHLFGTRRLKDGYDPVIDTSQPGLAALTPESVTTPTYAASFFISLNVSTALLGRAGTGGPND
jgi:hypothetical protein